MGENKVNIIPKPKKMEKREGFLQKKEVKLVSEVGDERILMAISSFKLADDGMPLVISVGDDGESYTLTIEADCIMINAAGSAGAFYAIQTLKQIFAKDTVSCCYIEDEPDFKYRGFYHDVTRGKIPTLETLKELVDTMASYKMNSLQLYIEHAFEFKEYEEYRDKLGYLTKNEVCELDSYCKEHFIELIPSISTFGHLYHLLSSKKYMHLSELPDYMPTSHYWKERMFHHTINPEIDESFEVIKSLIDQYLEVSTSDKFNICADETFDLGNGVNEGKDKGRLYVNFIKKVTNYLISKGKTVMMWGDIILEHPEYMEELSDNIIFLNWSYDKEPASEQFEKVFHSGKKQILCPGTSSWNAFTEDVLIEEGNIITLAKYAGELNAEGILNTNWGDLGNVASITTSIYGLILGAAVSWNKDTKADEEFRKAVSKEIYGDARYVDVMAKISSVKNILNWYKVVTGTIDHVQFGCIPLPSFTEYSDAIEKLKRIKQELETLSYKDSIIKREILSAVQGFILTAVICAKIDGFSFDCGFDVNTWLEEFEKLWILRNKPSELDEAKDIIKYRLMM